MTILAQILSSKVRAEIFRILFGLSDDPLHMREIERRSGFTTGTVQQELKKLSSLDLVKKRKDGNRVYYQARKDHPLYPEIHRLVLKTNGMVEVLRSGLSPVSDRIDLAFVFGSQARGKASAASDIDLFIVGNLDELELHRLISQAEGQLNRSINYTFLAAQEFKKRKKEKGGFLSRVLAGEKIFIIGDGHGS